MSKSLAKYNFNISFILNILFFIVFIASLLFSISSVFSYLDNGLILSIGFFLLGLIFPRFAISLILVLLPLGGNRPNTIHFYYFFIATSALLLGLVFNCKFHYKKLLPENLRISILVWPLFFASLYALVSFLSLSGIPLSIISKEFSTYLDYGSMDTFFKSLTNLILVTEHSRLYPLISTFLTLQAYFIGLYTYQLITRNHKSASYFCFAIFIGLLHSLIVGLLDYYKFIDLNSFRSLDPIVNPGDIQFRLQSWFAHSGWFAEYLTLTIPFVMTILLFNYNFWLRVAFIILTLLIGEYVLILTYQRGGWISYPLTLVFIWIAIYAVRCIEKNNLEIIGALKKSILKVIVSLPLTIIATLIIISFLNQNQTSSISQYIERFKNIKQTSDRTDFIVAGYLIGLEHPFYGSASDSFAYEYERKFEEPSGKYHKKFNLPLHGTAHNAYAQTIAGKGLVGLVTLLGILAAMIVAIKFAVIKSELDIKERVTILICACFAIAFLVYANVQEVFYMHSLQVLFFVVISILSAQIPFGSYEVSPRQLQLFIKLIAITFIFHIIWEYITPAKVKRFNLLKNNIGCYHNESDPSDLSNKLNYSWCRKKAYQEFEVIQNTNLDIGINIKITASSLFNKSLEVLLTSNYFSPINKTLTPGETLNQFIILDKKIGEKIPVAIYAERSIVPFVVDSKSTDLRTISFSLTK